jgi:hypothetical protein
MFGQIPTAPADVARKPCIYFLPRRLLDFLPKPCSGNVNAGVLGYMREDWIVAIQRPPTPAQFARSGAFLLCLGERGPAS